MATRKPTDADVNLPFAALQLLAPPMRLVSAALWKVLKQRDVMQYGVVEEFVTSACETVPGMLTVRHQGKLSLGLRGRLILELCRTQPDIKVIEPHLKRIRAPAVPSTSAATMRKDVKIARTVESFHSFIHTLLTDPAERELFYKEEFPVDYGTKFDEELEKLLWEFLIRLDQLLPVPNLTQTVSWLSEAPSVLEECARSATQPQLLNILLQHQTCLGHLEPAASLPPNMGDSILESLSLPLSGRAASKQQTGAKASAVDPSSSGTQTRDKTSFITPVIGLISNKDVPVMMSASKKLLRSSEASSTEDATKKLSQQKNNMGNKKIYNDGEKKSEEEQEEEQNVSKRGRGMKRKQPDEGQSDSDQEEEEALQGMNRSGRMRIRKVRQRLKEQRLDERKNNGPETVRNEYLKSRAALATCLTQLDLKTLRLPDDPSLCSVFMSCLSSQPRVLIRKMPVASTSAKRNGRGGKTLKRQQSPRKKMNTSNRVENPDFDMSGLDDKENHPLLPSSSQLQTSAEILAASGDSEDYVADSEDEATKNFKGRLFMKRYYKTKHGTYVPTLREFWKPRMPRRDLPSAFSKHR